MISRPSDLQPDTPWSDTTWAHTPEEALVDHKSEARLCVATLLPFRNGQPDWEGFENSIRWMIASGEACGVELAFVLNADTGYIFDLDMDLYGEVIRRFRSAFPDPKIICGTTAVGAEGDTFRPEWYLPHLEAAQQFDNVEVMLMTSKLLNAVSSTLMRSTRSARQATTFRSPATFPAKVFNKPC